MPRIARIIATGYPHHITQRGNNRATVFFDDEDRQTYLHLLNLYAKKHHLQIWAYCLMNNHIHLLAVPENEGSLARGIGLTNQVYTQYLNRKMHQSGRIWQNRFFSCVVESDQYLWAVARYVERNPLKAGFAESAESYRWSSARAHMTGTSDPLLCANAWLATDDQNSYVEFVREEDEETDEDIRKATRTGRPFGSESFMEILEFRLNQSLKPRKPGRPRLKIGECPKNLVKIELPQGVPYRKTVPKAMTKNPHFTYRPIGILHSPYARRIDAPHQSTVVEGTESGELALATLELEDWLDEKVIQDLDGFDRLWLIFAFHRSEGWKSTVKPPRGGPKRGILATRSPHRPNPLGLSAVELVRIEGRTLHLRGVDLLDGTPVLDIKPYVPYADAFPDAKAGWIDELDTKLGRYFAPGLRKPR